MRIPLANEIDSRDGTSAKDERLTNMLGEDNNGQQMAALRPGLSAIVTATGNGNGLTNFNDILISVFGTVLGHAEGPSTIGAVTNSRFDFAQSPL